MGSQIIEGKYNRGLTANASMPKAAKMPNTTKASW
jgi:hypothetical protein